MTSAALIAGRLWREPESRTAKTGKPFATAIMREGTGDAAVWWSVIGFGDSAGELLQLKDGDALSVSGPFAVETYEKDGQTRLRHKIVADRIAAPRLKPRKAAPP